LILGVLLAHGTGGRKSQYLKVRDRQSYEFALASAAVAMDSAAGVMGGVRIALGGVGTVPWRSREAEQVLEGKPPSRELFAAAGRAAIAGARPLSDNSFKVALIQRTLVSALHELTGSAAAPLPA